MSGGDEVSANLYSSYKQDGYYLALEFALVLSNPLLHKPTHNDKRD